MKKILIASIIASLSIMTVGCTVEAPSEQDVMGVRSAIGMSITGENDQYNSNNILLDNEILKITFVKVNYDKNLGPSVEIEIENKSDKDITVQTREVSVDGVMTEAILTSDITAGKIENCEIKFISKDVEELKNIEGLFNVTYSDKGDLVDNYNFKALEKKENLEIDYLNSTDNKGIVLVDNEIIKVSYIGYSNKSSSEFQLELEIENKTNDLIIVQTRETSIDGKEVDTIFSSEITPGKMANENVIIKKKEIINFDNFKSTIHVSKADNLEEIGTFEFKIEK